MTLPSSIGNGLNFILKLISSRLNATSSDYAKPLLGYLLELNYHGQNLMINETMDSVEKLETSLIRAQSFVSALPKETPFLNFEQRYSSMFHF